MRKIWLLAIVLSVNCAASLLAAPQDDAKAVILAKVAHAADKVFKFADADQDGQLSPKEFKKADRQIPFQIRKLTTEHVIGAATPLEQEKDASALDVTQPVAPDQFRSHFIAAVKTADGDLRKAIAARPPQTRRRRRSSNANSAPFASNPGRRPVDDETTDQREARERRERQQQQQIAQMRAAYERDSFRPTPPPRERPTPSRGESGGGSKPQGGGGGPMKPGPGGKR